MMNFLRLLIKNNPRTRVNKGKKILRKQVKNKANRNNKISRRILIKIKLLIKNKNNNNNYWAEMNK